MSENNELLEYHCTNCGTRVNRDDTRCPNCDAELEGFIDEEEEIGTIFTAEDETVIEKSSVPEYHCPNCGTRINYEDEKCPSCGAVLECFDDEESDKTIDMKSYTSELEAEFDKSKLESAGIESFLKGTHTDGTLYTPSTIKLVVLKRDLKRAKEILEN